MLGLFCRLRRFYCTSLVARLFTPYGMERVAALRHSAGRRFSGDSGVCATTQVLAFEWVYSAVESTSLQVHMFCVQKRIFGFNSRRMFRHSLDLCRWC